MFVLRQNLDRNYWESGGGVGMRIRKVSTAASKHDINQTCINHEARSILSEEDAVLWRELPLLAEATTSFPKVSIGCLDSNLEPVARSL